MLIKFNTMDDYSLHHVVHQNLGTLQSGFNGMLKFLKKNHPEILNEMYSKNLGITVEEHLQNCKEHTKNLPKEILQKAEQELK